MSGNWTWIILIGAALLAIVAFWASRRNAATVDKVPETEAATARLYKEEDAARDPMDDGTV